MKRILARTARRFDDLTPVFNAEDANKVFAELEAENRKLKSLLIPDMFWEVDNTDDCIHDPRDSFENSFDQHTKVGQEMTFQTAVSTGNVTYRLTELNDDGSFEIEEVKNETE